MTDVSPPLPGSSQTRPLNLGIAWPLFFWLLLQLTALMLAGFRIPLSARFPVPEEQMALHEIYCVQMIASAMLFPLLFRSVAGSVLTIATAPLMVQLAGILAAQAEASVLLCLYPALWLIGLAMWAHVLRGERAKLYGVAGANLFVLGGALAAYFGREFGAPGQTFDWIRGYWGPLMGGLTLIEAGPTAGTVWAALGIFLFICIIAAFWRFRRDRSRLSRDRASNSLPR